MAKIMSFIRYLQISTAVSVRDGILSIPRESNYVWDIEGEKIKAQTGPVFIQSVSNALGI